MKTFALTALCLLTQAQACALLPPLWNDVEQLKNIFDDRRFAESFSSGDAIQVIEKKEDGWLIKTNHRKIDVLVHDEKQDMPGKRHFTLEFIADKNFKY